MHIGNLATLAAVAFLAMLIAVPVVRSRRRLRRMSLRAHGPRPVGDPQPDKATLLRIGGVAADGARSALG